MILKFYNFVILTLKFYLIKLENTANFYINYFDIFSEKFL